jgi:hypothetical protein
MGMTDASCSNYGDFNVFFSAAAEAGERDKPNEDWVGVTPNSVVVLDGVSGQKDFQGLQLQHSLVRHETRINTDCPDSRPGYLAHRCAQERYQYGNSHVVLEPIMKVGDARVWPSP